MQSQLETFVLTASEGQARGLHPISADKTMCVACASAAGEIVLSEWFNNQISAMNWALEKSVWTYTL